MLRLKLNMLVKVATCVEKAEVISITIKFNHCIHINSGEVELPLFRHLLDNSRRMELSTLYAFCCKLYKISLYRNKPRISAELQLFMNVLRANIFHMFSVVVWLKQVCCRLGSDQTKKINTLMVSLIRWCYGAANSGVLVKRASWKNPIIKNRNDLA